MKYIITESQIKNLIFKFLDDQDFIQVKRGYHIYFVYSESDKYSQIMYDEDIPWVGMSDNLCEEISLYFSISKDEAKKIIGLWIKRKFKVKDEIVVQSYSINRAMMLMVPW